MAAGDSPGGVARIDALNALSHELCFSDAGRALQLASQAAQLSQSGEFVDQPYLPGLAASLFNQARAHNQLGSYAESLACLLEAQPHYVAQEDESGLMWLFNEFGRLYYFLSDYPNALDYYLKELHLARKLNHTNRQAGTLHNIGLVYASTADYAQALETMSEGLRIAQAAGDRWVEGFLLGGLAETHFQLKNYAQALDYGQQSLALARTAGLPGLINGTLLAVSWAYFESGQVAQAQACLQEVRQLAEASGDKRGCGEALRAAGEQASRQGGAAEALPLLQQALSAAEDLGEKTFIANCHLALTQVYRKLRKYRLALTHYERYHALEKETFDEKSDLRLKSLTVTHRLENAHHEAEIYHLRNVMLQQEIDERRKAQDALEFLAHHDPLTGLLNRRIFFSLAESAVAHAVTLGNDLAVIMLDADHFKAINDQFGHQAGDKALAEIAALAQSQVRDSDLVCRYGGEEFVILLSNTSAQEAWRIAERLRLALASQPLQTETGPAQVTISLGVAAMKFSRPLSLERLLYHADLALYQSKASGRNRTTLYQDPDFEAR